MKRFFFPLSLTNSRHIAHDEDGFVTSVGNDIDLDIDHLAGTFHASVDREAFSLSEGNLNSVEHRCREGMGEKIGEPFGLRKKIHKMKPGGRALAIGKNGSFGVDAYEQIFDAAQELTFGFHLRSQT